MGQAVTERIPDALKDGIHQVRIAVDAARRHPMAVFWPIGLAFVALYGPTIARLSSGPWEQPQDGHGPFIIAVACGLAYFRLKAFDLTPSAPRPVLGGLILAFGLACYAVGRSQTMLFVEVGSVLPVLMGLLLIFHGWRLLRQLWFPLLFLMFAVPIPGWIMNGLTGPLKQVISEVATDWLYALGYPISQNGVVLYIGQYELLVKDACAGLNSIFSLSAVGLFYVYLAGHPSRLHNIALLLLMVPAAFIANLVRVLILLLVTYHLGDAAGQGFIHDFSGIVMFTAALGVFLMVDTVLIRLLRRRADAPAAA
ncbi:MAG: exosortase B [Alphaproteobacteria bacterium]